MGRRRSAVNYPITGAVWGLQCSRNLSQLHTPLTGAAGPTPQPHGTHVHRKTGKDPRLHSSVLGTAVPTPGSLQAQSWLHEPDAARA